MSELQEFVGQALGKGHPRAEVKDILLRADWPADEIEEAMAHYADLEFPLPVPKRSHSGSAREAFLYLVTFTALYICMVSFGALLFGLIDSAFPDPIERSYRGDNSEGLAFSIASLIVAFPLYLSLTRQHLNAYATDPARRTSSVRRWLTYLTMFVAACFIIGSLISLISGVLSGDLAARFLLKSCVVLALASTVFFFYRWEIRLGEREGQA